MRQSFRQRVQQFFYGRNGQDQFGLFLMVIALPFAFINSTVCTLIAWVIMAFAIYRILSKNIARRRKENIVYMKMWTKAIKPFKNLKARYKARKYYRVFRCPKCRQKLRVPKYKGRVKVRCTKCNEAFIRKT